MNHILLVSGITSVAGLLMIYLVAAGMEPEEVEIDGINAEHVGLTISTSGEIEQKRLHENGHIFLTVGDGKSSIQVPIFKDVAKNVESGKLQKGMRVKVRGLVDEYRGDLQVVPRKPADIELIGK